MKGSTSLPNLLYRHCTALSQNSRTPNFHLRTPSFASLLSNTRTGLKNGHRLENTRHECRELTGSICCRHMSGHFAAYFPASTPKVKAVLVALCEPAANAYSPRGSGFAGTIFTDSSPYLPNLTALACLSYRSFCPGPCNTTARYITGAFRLRFAGNTAISALLDRHHGFPASQ